MKDENDDLRARSRKEKERCMMKWTASFQLMKREKWMRWRWWSEQNFRDSRAKWKGGLKERKESLLSPTGLSFSCGVFFHFFHPWYVLNNCCSCVKLNTAIIIMMNMGRNSFPREPLAFFSSSTSESSLFTHSVFLTHHIIHRNFPLLLMMATMMMMMPPHYSFLIRKKKEKNAFLFSLCLILKS